jgi:hypothetical protein
MVMQFSKWLGVLVLAAASSMVASAAIADTDPANYEPIQVEAIPDTVNRVFFDEGGDFFRNRSYRRQVDFLLGTGSLIRPGFTENEEYRDSEKIENLYRYLLDQQVSSDPIIRTLDLSNPYNTSLRVNPGLRANSRVMGSEFVFEKLPPQY